MSISQHQLHEFSHTQLPGTFRQHPGPAYEYRPSSQNQNIQSPFCGQLQKLLPPESLPGVDAVLAHGLQSTIGHTHHTFREYYFVMQGSLLLALFGPGQSQVDEILLQQGDGIVIMPGTGHQVRAGSPKNQVLVLCSPAFNPADEWPCAELEKGPAREDPLVPPAD